MFGYKKYTFFGYSINSEKPSKMTVIADQDSPAWVAAAEQFSRQIPVIVKIEYVGKKNVEIVEKD